jgi:ABC-type multidrug transport system fused ATPase/permease subunit
VAPDFYLPLRQLGLRFHAGMSGATAAKRIFEILDTPLPQRSAPHESLFAYSVLRVVFENVSYTYANRETPALENVSFEIPYGKLTALVGASGAGKSTLASLLLRFIEPSSGQILVAGHPLLETPVEKWRRLVAWVPQNPYLFQDSLAANLRLARPQASETDLVRACRQAGLMDFIATLPQGFETMIGERGARLSGGQAQRLALARAFLKDAPFLLLDEPTSSLDPGLEAELQQSVQTLMKGRTTLVIAHRLSTVYQADQIIVLEAGRVVEIGKHNDLIQQEGKYFALVKSNSKD